MNIAFLGNFVEKKGSQDFIRIVKKYHQQYNFYIFGYIVDQITYNKIKHLISKQITYQEGQLGKLLHQYHIDCAFAGSIWPETFSRTVFNCFQANIPVITNNLGFPFVYLGKNYPLIYYSEKEQADVIIEKINNTQLQNVKKQLSSYLNQSFINKQQTKYQLLDQLL